MIPPFDENGYLPPGIHPATLAEIEARFGQEPELRRAQMESLRWLIDLARQSGIERLSFGHKLDNTASPRRTTRPLTPT